MLDARATADSLCQQAELLMPVRRGLGRDERTSVAAVGELDFRGLQQGGIA